MREGWEVLMNHWHVDPIKGGRKFDDIAAAYAEPRRFYHTLDHVLAVLATVESLSANAKNLNAVKLAAWLEKRAHSLTVVPDVTMWSRPNNTVETTCPVFPRCVVSRNWSALSRIRSCQPRCLEVYGDVARI